MASKNCFKLLGRVPLSLMGKAERIEIVRSIEKIRGSYVVCYVTSTRENVISPMAMDAPRKIYEHLRVLPGKANIDLFLHSNGGEATVPWRLVTLIREYAKEFRVLIPHRAFSAATLTAMGADAIVMHPMAMLGPTDPTVGNDFNPQDPLNPQRRIGISVEDVTAYFALVREDAAIEGEAYRLEAFEKLASSVHPLALGNVKRHLSLSRLMAHKLLTLHMDPTRDAAKIDQIVENLTSKLFYHGHPINRREAREQVGLATVQDASDELERLMWSLYAEYEGEMRMEEPFRPDVEFLARFPDLQPMPGQPWKVTPPALLRTAAIESVNFSDFYEMEYEVSGEKQPTGMTNIAMITRRQGWVRV